VLGPEVLPGIDSIVLSLQLFSSSLPALRARTFFFGFLGDYDYNQAQSEKRAAPFPTHTSGKPGFPHLSTRKHILMASTSLLALLLVTNGQLYSAFTDVADVSLLPALVISNSEERFERSAAMLRTFGFGAMHSPAVYVNTTPTCGGTNGHRLAIRKAWQRIMDEDRAMAVFEDDAVPPRGVALSENHHKKHDSAKDHDLIWLGGIGRLGNCHVKMDTCFQTRILGQKASNTFYTDHARWVTPRAARIMLGCTRPCIKEKGWGVDSIIRAVCRVGLHGAKNTTWRQRKSITLAPLARMELPKLATSIINHYCLPSVKMELLHRDRTPLRCRLPPESPAQKTSPKERTGLGSLHRVSSSPLVSVGYFWQQQSNTSSANDQLREKIANETFAVRLLNTTIENTHACHSKHMMHRMLMRPGSQAELTTKCEARCMQRHGQCAAFGTGRTKRLGTPVCSLFKVCGAPAATSHHKSSESTPPRAKTEKQEDDAPAVHSILEASMPLTTYKEPEISSELVRYFSVRQPQHT
jgi:hypothetical protein